MSLQRLRLHARVSVQFVKQHVCMRWEQADAGGEAAGEAGLRLRARDPHPGAVEAALRGRQPAQLRGSFPVLLQAFWP